MKQKAALAGVLTALLALSAVAAGPASANTSVDTRAGAPTTWPEPLFRGDPTVDTTLVSGACQTIATLEFQVGSALSTFADGTVVFYSNVDCTNPIGLPTGVYPDLQNARSYKLEPRA